MAASGGSKNRIFIWLGLVGLLIAVFIAWFLLPTKDWIQGFGDWIKGYGAVGVVIFAVIYVLAVIVLAPAGVFTIVADLVFGAWAFPPVVVAATAGATLAFLIARHLVRQKVESLVEEQPKFKDVDEAVSEDGWKIVGLLRLSPLVPFNLQNYFFGVTDVGLLPYVAATFFGIMPPLACASALATGGGLAERPEIDVEQGCRALLAVGLVATAIVAFIITRKAKRKLKEAGVGKHSQ